MSTLGPCVGFCLKYDDAMERLYWSRDDDEESLKNARRLLEGRSDQDEILEMVDRVGEQACAEVKGFLLDLREVLAERLQQFCNVKKRQRQSTIAEEWDARLKVWPLDRREPEGEVCEAGIYFGREVGHQVLFPYFWVKGGREARDELCKSLKALSPKTETDPSWDEGSVVLDEIPLEPRPDLSLDSGALRAQVTETIKKIKRTHIDALFRVAGLIR